MDLNKIKLGYSPLSDSIYLYRHGKNRNVALDKRNAEFDVMAVLVESMMYDAPNGSIKNISFGEKHYEITVKPVKENKNG